LNGVSNSRHEPLLYWVAVYHRYGLCFRRSKFNKIKNVQFFSNMLTAINYWVELTIILSTSLEFVVYFNLSLPNIMFFSFCALTPPLNSSGSMYYSGSSAAFSINSTILCLYLSASSSLSSIQTQIHRYWPSFYQMDSYLDTLQAFWANQLSSPVVSLHPSQGVHIDISWT